MLLQWNHAPIVVDDVWNVAMQCDPEQFTNDCPVFRLLPASVSCRESAC